MMTDQDEILGVFKKTEALLEGHFQLTSGLHSNRYFQCALVLQHPEHCSMLSEQLKEKLISEVGQPDIVVGPALGGVTLAYELARAFGVNGIFAERKDGQMSIRRGFQIKPGQKVLVVEDVVTTGGSVKEVIEVLKDFEADIIGVASIVDRSNGTAEFAYPFVPLIKMEVQTYTQETCLMCKSKLPLTKPGSRK